jgi:hypothetical protein
VSRTPPTGWQEPGFDDGGWPAAKVVASRGEGAGAWRDLIWDSVLEEHYAGGAYRLFPEPAGNVRDRTGGESFPPLKAVPLDFELPADPADDAHFLRYARASLVALAGMPGVPPEKPADKKP